MDQIHDGDLIELHDGALWRDGEKLAAGEMLEATEIELRMEDGERVRLLEERMRRLVRRRQQHDALDVAREG